MSVYKSFVLHLEVSVFKSMCCTCATMCMSVYESFVQHLCLSVYKSFLLHLDVSAHKSPGGAQFTNLFFLFVSVFFETGLFVSVVSIRVRNTETNRKVNFLVSRNKPKNNRNRLCFGSFRFKPKLFFVCFEDTLAAGKMR